MKYRIFKVVLFKEDIRVHWSFIYPIETTFADSLEREGIVVCDYIKNSFILLDVKVFVEEIDYNGSITFDTNNNSKIQFSIGEYELAKKK